MESKFWDAALVCLNKIRAAVIPCVNEVQSTTMDIIF